MVATAKEVLVPDIGDFKDVDVIEVLVSAGEHIDAEDPLITLESDKATMDVPSPHAGVIKELRIKVGDKVSQGSPILTMELVGESEQEEVVASTRSAEELTPAVEPRATVVEATPKKAPSAAPVAEPGEVIDVRVPDIGDFKDVDVIEVLVSAGEHIDAEDPLITLESDKATMDVPSPHAGVVKAVKVKVGDKVSEGSLILSLQRGEAPIVAAAPPPELGAPAPPTPQARATPSAPARAPEKRPSPTAAMAAVEEAVFRKAHASPAVRRFARELGVDLGRVKGTGPKERILKEDVQVFVKGRLAQPEAAGAIGFAVAEMPEIDFSKFGEVELQPLSRIKKIAGPNLHRSWITVPHVTQHDEADITDLEAFRQELKEEAQQKGIRLTPLAFVMRAVVAALKKYPQFNASLDRSAENLIVKKYYHIGVAVDTPDGLVVPVIRDVNQKGLLDLAAELGETSARARDKKLTPTDMQGGCFTISSLGGIGGTAFTPIVNAPEVAILGVSRSKMQPVYLNGEFVPRLMLPLSLSYDHRVIDGAQAARFTTYLSLVLADVRRLLL